jgi:hyperosmotically inducible periplasmic protein
VVKRTACWAVLMLACAAAAPAAANRPDAVLAKDVVNELLSYTPLTVFDDVLIGVDGGVVTLTGKVTMPFKASDIGRLVTRVAGAQNVRNEIQVLPLSRFDDSLRTWIADAVYRHPAFVQYAATTHPPIHILVEDGHVTLTGVVNNDVERSLAYSIARSSSALSVLSELKTDAEMKPPKGKRP